MCFACFRGRHSSKLTSKVPATAKQGSSKSVLLGRDHYTASSSVIEQIVGSPDSELMDMRADNNAIRKVLLKALSSRSVLSHCCRGGPCQHGLSSLC